jgi:VWFA-related protein
MYKKRLTVLLAVTALVLTTSPLSVAWMQGAVRVTLGEADLNAFPNIALPVTVVNANGVPVLDLQQENFEALEDEVPIQIEAVTTRSNPDVTIAVALVLDLSGSAPIEDIKEAAHQLLDHLGPDDRVCLIGFNTPLDFDKPDPAKEVECTNDKDRVREVIDGLIAAGESAVYEAIYKGVLWVAEETADRRAVIAMTDGYDTISRPGIASADTPRTAAKERGIPVFTVGVYNPAFASDPDYLNVLARETGGRYQDQEAGDLGTLFQNVVEQLRTDYRVTLHTDKDQDGKDHVLKIRVTTPQGLGDAERTVAYPPPPPVPDILKLQRDVNGELRDVEAGMELKGQVLLVPQISAQNPLARVEYYIDGLLAYTADVGASRGQEQHKPWEWKWDTCAAAEGDHTLEIIAYDDAGYASDRFSTGLLVTPSPWCIVTQNIWLVVGIVAVVVFLVVVLFFALRRRVERCPVCGNVMDPSWGGICQFCAAAAIPAPTGPATVPALPVEPPTTPRVPSAAERERVPTRVVGPAPGARGDVGMASPAVQKTVSVRREPEAMAWLVMEKGPRAGREFRLQEVTSIGRTGENNIILDDPSVSRQHAKVRLEGQTFTVFDLAATNPTKVNGQEIGRHQLVDGDRVEIGNIILVFKQVQPTQE